MKKRAQTSRAKTSRRTSQPLAKDAAIGSKPQASAIDDYYRALRQSPEFLEQQKLIKEKTRSFVKRLANKEIPQVDSTLGYRAPEKIPTSTEFDADLSPIYGPIRRGRREMLRRLFKQEGGKIYRITPDVFTAAELRRQEQQDQFYVQQYIAILGKGASWRDSLILGCRTSKDDYAELSWILAEVMRCADMEELKLFMEACKRVKRLLKQGISGDSKFNRSRLAATHYVISVEQEEQRTPTRGEVERFVRKSKLPYPTSRTKKRKSSGSNSHRFFIGPVLSRLPVAAPWGAQKQATANRVPIKG